MPCRADDDPHAAFRAPHHTISHAGLVGEAIAASRRDLAGARGVLFWTNFLIRHAGAEVMRQPIEDKVVRSAEPRAR